MTETGPAYDPLGWQLTAPPGGTPDSAEGPPPAADRGRPDAARPANPDRHWRSAAAQPLEVGTTEGGRLGAAAGQWPAAPADLPGRGRHSAAAYRDGSADESVGSSPRPVEPRLVGEPAGPVAPEAGGRIAGRGAGLGLGGLGGGRSGARERELTRRITVPVGGCRRVVVVSIKGGVGKTTTVAVAGSLLAALRRDRVVAADASSDWGTLAARLSVVPRQTMRGLAGAGRQSVSERGVLAQLTPSPSGMYVIGSSPQSVISAPLADEEYLRALHLLDYVANLLLVDIGAGLQQPFLPAALRTCDQLVVATAATWDAAQSAAAALDWLAARGHRDLVERSIVVMSSLSVTKRRRRGFVAELETDLRRRARALVEVPFDPALQSGGRILLRKLGPATRTAFLEVAAEVLTGVTAVPPAPPPAPHPLAPPAAPGLGGWSGST